MWNLYSSIAIGGVLLAFAPPKDVTESNSTAPAVAFMLTWPVYLLLDLGKDYLRRRRK